MKKNGLHGITLEVATQGQSILVEMVKSFLSAVKSGKNWVSLIVGVAILLSSNIAFADEIDGIPENAERYDPEIDYFEKRKKSYLDYGASCYFNMELFLNEDQRPYWKKKVKKQKIEGLKKTKIDSIIYIHTSTNKFCYRNYKCEKVMYIVNKEGYLEPQRYLKTPKECEDSVLIDNCYHYLLCGGNIERQDAGSAFLMDAHIKNCSYCLEFAMNWVNSK